MKREGDDQLEKEEVGNRQNEERARKRKCEPTGKNKTKNTLSLPEVTEDMHHRVTKRCFNNSNKYNLLCSEKVKVTNNLNFYICKPISFNFLIIPSQFLDCVCNLTLPQEGAGETRISEDKGTWLLTFDSQEFLLHRPTNLKEMYFQLTLLGLPLFFNPKFISLFTQTRLVLLY